MSCEVFSAIREFVDIVKKTLELGAQGVELGEEIVMALPLFPDYATYFPEIVPAQPELAPVVPDPAPLSSNHVFDFPKGNPNEVPE
ncbi:hypothetical protein Tco_0580530 [Tanacetum coccineum]